MAEGETLIAVVVASSRVGCSAVHALTLALRSDPPEQCVRVRAVLRDANKRDLSWDPAVVETFSGLDVSDPSSLAGAFRGVSRALLVAPQLENRDQIVNSMLLAAKGQGVCHVVLIGGVFQEEERIHFHRHWMSSRRKAEELGIAWTQLECSDFMENLLGSCHSVASESKLYGVFPEGVSSPVALEDIGKAAASVLLDPSAKHHNRGYRIVGPEALTPLQVVDKISAVAGIPVEFVDLGLEESKRHALAAGRAGWQVDGFAEWQQLYFSSGRLANVQSDLPSLGVEPTFLQQWLTQRSRLFKLAPASVSVSSA